MWLFRKKRERPSSATCDGPAIVSSADGAVPAVEVVSQMYNAMPRKRGLIEWLWAHTGHRRESRMKTDVGGEMQMMLPNHTQDGINAGDVCLLAESPYRILRVNDFL
ncbi:unnamed protein product [Euphydryas editha]|uniref:MoeA C-terminal domain-containing protein n=1 Tax=Euphydryas editha TaxID=104508 RepID=A0AAU9UVP5_EUPED|nr:unnamed protein product [Euphydryas editha]